MTRPPPRVLSVAGSDSSGGAGIQADIKTITMLGGYAMTAITAITAQNTRGVDGVWPMPGSAVLGQCTACEDIGIDAIKIGMLASAEQAGALWDFLIGQKECLPIVLDPVMVATSGATLASGETVREFGQLMDLATIVTPNLPELAALTDMPVESAEQIIEAAMLLAERHDVQVLAKGGHGEGNRITDRIVSPSGKVASFDHARIETRHTHGTGCTLSAALATLLGHGQPLTHAVRLARQFTYAAIENAPGFGQGSGPLGHQAAGRASR